MADLRFSPSLRAACKQLLDVVDARRAAESGDAADSPAPADWHEVRFEGVVNHPIFINAPSDRIVFVPDGGRRDGAPEELYDAIAAMPSLVGLDLARVPGVDLRLLAAALEKIAGIAGTAGLQELSIRVVEGDGSCCSAAIEAVCRAAPNLTCLSVVVDDMGPRGRAERSTTTFPIGRHGRRRATPTLDPAFLRAAPKLRRLELSVADVPDCEWNAPGLFAALAALPELVHLTVKGFVDSEFHADRPECIDVAERALARVSDLSIAGNVDAAAFATAAAQKLRIGDVYGYCPWPVLKTADVDRLRSLTVDVDSGHIGVVLPTFERLTGLTSLTLSARCAGIDVADVAAAVARIGSLRSLVIGCDPSRRSCMSERPAEAASRLNCLRSLPALVRVRFDPAL